MTENVGPETGKAGFWFPGMASLQHESNRALSWLCARMRVDAQTHTQPGPAAAPRPLPVRPPPQPAPHLLSPPGVAWAPCRPHHLGRQRSGDFRGRLLPEPNLGVVVLGGAALFCSVDKSCPPRHHRVHGSTPAVPAPRGLRSLPSGVSTASALPCSHPVLCRPLLLPSASGSSPDGRHAAPERCFWGSRAACAGVGAALLPSVPCAQNRACVLQSRRSSRADAAGPGTRPSSAAHTHG